MKKKNIPFFIFNPLYSDKFVVKTKIFGYPKYFGGGSQQPQKVYDFPPILPF